MTRCPSCACSLRSRLDVQLHRCDVRLTQSVMKWTPDLEAKERAFSARQRKRNRKRKAA